VYKRVGLESAVIVLRCTTANGIGLILAHFHSEPETLLTANLPLLTAAIKLPALLRTTGAGSCAMKPRVFISLVITGPNDSYAKARQRPAHRTLHPKRPSTKDSSSLGTRPSSSRTGCKQCHAAGS